MTSKDAARVLVVDDEEGVRLYLGQVLSEMGCEVITADTLEEARECILLQSPMIDLVLLDKNLPDGSGLDLLAEAKGHDPDLEIVLITGYASLEAAVTALRFGAGDFLTKPFEDIAILSGKLRNAVERARRARERTRLISDLKDREAMLETEVAGRTAELESALETLRTGDAQRRRLMANVAHDLRTPLTTIQGYVEMLLRPDLVKERQESYLRSILGQCKRLGRLTWDLTFLARQADGQLEWRFSKLETGKVLRGAVLELLPLFEQTEVQVECDVHDAAEEIWGDEDRLMQVLTNLLGNAAKFAPRGSVVRVIAEPDEDSVLISVADAGMGVPFSQRSEIFERYFSNDAYGRGEGIGLSICRDIVVAHGGRIWVEDSDEGGARFKMALPVNASVAA